MYVTIWEFVVREGAEAAFERLHGPAGAWEALFRRAPDFVGTELLASGDGSRRYLTIDRWTSARAYADFRAREAEAYDAMDAAGEALTEAERHVGGFTPA